ncbi:hypothetical protein C1645_770898 [Glomus cerebriforme]|uniref:HMG box domain-containing protein n=1 Tax=Glomus cerebriforme TaxID=658196 RepID=A0A397SVL8_9GLOM|nr:hypothetical protein C1645_770898 [Glomus cerebriforme]
MTQENNTKSTSSAIEKTNNDLQDIQVPFPVKINFNRIYYYNQLNRRVQRPTNAFVIFIRELVQEFERNNISFTMREVSAFAREKWRNSPIKIKQDYINCSCDIDDFKAYINKPPIYRIIKF